MEKKFKQVNNWLNYNSEEQQYEVNKQKSLTIPDQALSIKEILNRFARGLDIEGFKPIYDDDINDNDDYLPDPRTLDLAEREELKEQFQNELKSFLEYNQQANETVGLTKTENLAVDNAKEEAP
jgi:hypothetical protein